MTEELNRYELVRDTASEYIEKLNAIEDANKRENSLLVFARLLHELEVRCESYAYPSREARLPKNKVKIVFAGNRQEFAYFCREHGINSVSGEAIYPSSPDKIKGLHAENVEIIRYGTWRSHKYVNEIEAVLWRIERRQSEASK